jgi:predicted RNA methylase
VQWDDGVRQWSRLQGLEEVKVAARFNIRISGQMKRIVKAGRLATTLSSRLKFKTKLLTFVVKGAQVSIDLHISDAFITAGLALSSASVAAGGVEHGLRSTTAAAMVMCLDFENKSSQFLPRSHRGKDALVVLDPMCGKGSILGALLKCGVNMVVGVDNDISQLRVANSNNTHALIVQSDSRCLPLAPSSVDQVVCDLPFGLKYNKDDFKQLITSTLTEVCRVMVESGRAVFLFSRSERQFLESAAKNSGFQLINTFDVMLGALEATIFVFFKAPTRMTSCS